MERAPTGNRSDFSSFYYIWKVILSAVRFENMPYYSARYDIMMVNTDKFEF